jgi:hypothetical protein
VLNFCSDCSSLITVVGVVFGSVGACSIGVDPGEAGGDVGVGVVVCVEAGAHST